MRYFIILISTFLIIGNVLSQELSKKFEFEYPVNLETVLLIKNSWGNINFETIFENKIIISGEIKSKATNLKKAQKRLNLFKIYKDNIDNQIIVETKILKKDFYNDNKNIVNVNYTIKLPLYLRLVIENKFGDVNFKEHNGKITLNLYKGNFTADILLFKETKPLSSFKIQYSDIKIGKTNWLNLDVKSTNLYIGKAKSLVINSELSIIKADTCNIIYANSENDIYKLGIISKIDFQSKKTALNIAVLQRGINYTGAYKNINIKYIPADFDVIKINNKQASINLFIDDNANYKIFAQADLGTILIPKKSNINKTIDENFERVEGIVGKGKKPKSKVEVTTSYGRIKL